MVFYRQSNNKRKIQPKQFHQILHRSIKSSLCDYTNVFILVAGNATVNASNDADVPFKHCASCSACKTEINDVQIHIAMPMYNLFEYPDNYSDTSGSLWQFKRDEASDNNVDLTVDNSQSFKNKVTGNIKNKNKCC